MFVPVQDEEADCEAQRELPKLGIEEERIMSELKVYGMNDPEVGDEYEMYKVSEVDKVLAEQKAREDVLVTDNRNLLDKVKMLENHLRENAEHFKRNEAQILKNADKVIAEKDKEIARLDDLAHAHNIELLRKENLIAELKSLKQALMADDLRYRYRIRHQKYKRCLAMAMWCWGVKELNRYGDKDYMDFAEKWRQRWLKIAEKFKEAK